MFKWLKDGGREERGWKFWFKIIFALFVIVGVVTLVVYNLIPENQ